MSKDPVYSEYAYMTFEDIRYAFSHANDNDDHTQPKEENTIIAIKAPIGTKIEIPDP